MLSILSMLSLPLLVLGICLLCWLAPQVPPPKYLASLKPRAKSPTKPQFINSKLNPGARRTPQSLPPMPQTTFEQIQQEAAIRERGTQRVSPQTANDLYRLVQGDGAMVARLIEHTKTSHPNKSEQWVWEKTIQDLERDRGYR